MPDLNSSALFVHNLNNIRKGSHCLSVVHGFPSRSEISNHRERENNQLDSSWLQVDNQLSFPKNPSCAFPKHQEDSSLLSLYNKL